MINTVRNITNWLAEALIGSSDKKYVTPHNALSYPPIWYAVNKICGHVGQLPLTLHRRLDRGADVARAHPAYKLLRERPNAWQTPAVFKELMQCHCLLWGNAYAWIRKEGGRPVELVPLYPGRTAPELVRGTKQYLHLVENGDEYIAQWKQPSEGSYIVLQEDEVFHLPGLGFNGYAGESLWKVASDSWRIGLASDDRIKQGFENGFKAAMLLEAPPEAFRKEEDAREFITEFNKYHSGSENADRAGLLTRGIKANVMQMNSQEAEMVEHRRYQRQDVALWFLLESILGDDSSVSYNSLEQKNLAYLSNCLMRWLVKWEEEANRKLLATNSNLYYFKYNTAALLRSDYRTTVESLGVAITHRMINPNEAREKLDLNPYEGGDAFENPAITPGQATMEENDDADEMEESQTDTEDDDTSNESDEVESRNRVVMARLDHLLGVERKRVQQCATQKNFVAAIDRFYEGWAKTLAKAVEDFGGDADYAAEVCDKHKQALLGCADTVTTDEELKAAVSAEIKGWEDDCRILAERTTAAV